VRPAASASDNSPSRFAAASAKKVNIEKASSQTDGNTPIAMAPATIRIV
jgi:hypothetical protein